MVLTKIEISEYQMIGEDYEGPIAGDTLRESFLKSKTLIEEGSIDGTLAILYYEDATTDNDTIKCFTGIIVANQPDAMPRGMEYRKFNSKGAIKARFEGHRLVTPSPLDIKAKVEQFAQEENLKLQSLFVEKYFSNNAIEIDYLLEE